MVSVVIWSGNWRGRQQCRKTVIAKMPYPSASSVRGSVLVRSGQPRRGDQSKRGDPCERNAVERGRVVPDGDGAPGEQRGKGAPFHRRWCAPSVASSRSSARRAAIGGEVRAGVPEGTIGTASLRDPLRRQDGGQARRRSDRAPPSRSGTRAKARGPRSPERSTAPLTLPRRLRMAASGGAWRVDSKGVAKATDRENTRTTDGKSKRACAN